MGKRIIPQRRGKGTQRYLSPSHRFAGKLSYPSRTKEVLKGEIVDLIKSVGHSAPLMIVKYEDSQVVLLPAPLGVKVGQQVFFGGAEATIGSAIPLENIPLGSPVCNIEIRPLDNGKLLRAAGTSAQIIAKENNKVVLKLPSKKQIYLNPQCFATVGIVSGVGRLTRPLVKAGNGFYKKKAKGKLVNKVKGVAMNAVDHPHGKTHRRHRRMSATVRRIGRCPGQKVGLLAARKTGRGK